MTTLFQDPSLTQPDASSVLQAPGQSAPGIGLGGPQPGLGIASPNVAQDAMQTRVNAMPVDQRIFSGLGEVGAALKGDPSPMSVQDQQQQTLKMNNFKLLNETMGALQQGLTLIQGTSGEDRKRLATAYASKLDSTEPGMGQVFSALSDKPGMLDMLKQNAHLLPQSWQMEIVNDPQSALKRLGTPEGQATFNAAMEVPQIDNATQRGMFLLGHWQQLVSPELAKEIGNPTNLSTGDLVKINNAVKENPQYAKLAIPDDALRVALTHDTFASSLHLMDSKGVQASIQKRAESGTWSAPYEMNGAQVQKNDATGEIRTAVTRAPVVNVNNVAPVNLTENGKKAYADLAIEGKLPPGFRGQAMADRNNFLNDEGEKRYGTGGTGVSIAGEQATAAGNKAAITQNQKDLTAIKPYKDMLDKNANIAIDLAGKVLKTNSALANKPITWLEQNMSDNPEVGEFMAQNHFVTTEAARVLNNPRLVGQMTDTAVKDMQEVVNGNAPLGTYARVLQRIMKDGNNRVDAMQAEHDRLVGSFGKGNKSAGGLPSGWSVEAH